MRIISNQKYDELMTVRERMIQAEKEAESMRIMLESAEKSRKRIADQLEKLQTMKNEAEDSARKWSEKLEDVIIMRDKAEEESEKWRTGFTILYNHLQTMEGCVSNLNRIVDLGTYLTKESFDTINDLLSKLRD